MKRMIVGAVLLVASMPVVGHPENMSPQEVYDLAQGEVQRIRDEMNEAQITRFDLLLRVGLIERYMHWFVPEFTKEWTRRFPEKAENMKQAGVWPDDKDLYGARFSRVETVVGDEWVRSRKMEAYIEDVANRVDAMVEAMRAAGIDVPLP